MFRIMIVKKLEAPPNPTKYTQIGIMLYVSEIISDLRKASKAHKIYNFSFTN